MKYFPLTLIALVVILPIHVFAAPVAQKNPIFPQKSYFSSFAYTGSSTPHIGIFAVTFTITATGEDVFIPATLERLGTGEDDVTKGVEYSFYDGADVRLTTGNSASMLIGKNSAQKGVYTVNAGTSATFTLLSLFDAPPNAKVINEMYRMRIEGLRYAIRESNNTLLHEVNGIENWKTKEIHIAE